MTWAVAQVGAADVEPSWGVRLEHVSHCCSRVLSREEWALGINLAIR